MSMQEMQQELEQWDEVWAEEQEKARAGGGSVLKAGDYQAKIVISRVERSDWGDLTLVMRWEDLAGEGIVTVYDNLSQEVGRSIAAGRVKALGYVGPLSLLPQACAQGMFDDKICDIRVKDNPSKDDPDKIYKVVYVNRVHDDVPFSGDFRPASADDDIPF